MDNINSEILAYIEQFDKEQQEQMKELYHHILSWCPLATVKISWGMPTFVFHGNLIHFAQQKHHLGIYPGETGVAQFKEQLEKQNLKYSKGAIQFPSLKELPINFIKEIVLYRMQENEHWAFEKKMKKEK